MRNMRNTPPPQTATYQEISKEYRHGFNIDNCVKKRYREYVYSVAVYLEYLTRLGEMIIFEPWRETHFSQPS